MVVALALLGSSSAWASCAVTQEHVLEVDLTSSKAMKTKQTWTVTLQEPKECADGVTAPEGMDGARSGDAHIKEGLAWLPTSGAQGDAITFVAEDEVKGGPFSGSFRSPLAGGTAKLVVTASSYTPLRIWPGTGTLDVTKPRNRVATVTWPSEGERTAVFSTWKDWWAVGDALERAVSSKIATTPKALGSLAKNKETPIAEVVDAVNAKVKLVPGNVGTWDFARKTAEIVADEDGTAAERGIVLIAALRAAGYDAVPATYADVAHAGVPAGLPAPALLDRPAVLVDGTVWLDPSSNVVAVPDVPRRLRGARVITPGNPARVVADNVVHDGQVTIVTTLEVQGSGTGVWKSVITADHAAAEALRERLGALDERGRIAAFEELVKVGHPELATFDYSGKRVEFPDGELEITVEAREKKLFRLMGQGFSGRVAALLAPALSAWLPPNLLIREVVDVPAPSGLQPLTAVRPPLGAVLPAAVVSRGYDLREDGVVLTTEALRPSRVPEELSTDAAGFLGEEAGIGSGVIFQDPDPKLTVKALSSDPDYGPDEVAAVQAVLWWRLDDEKRAKKAVKKGIKLAGYEGFAELLRRYAREDDARPWRTLFSLAESDRDRFAVIYGLEQRGSVRDAWQLATALTRSADASVQIEALIAVTRLQGVRPDPNVDPDAHRAWRDPVKILKSASKKAYSMPEYAKTGHPLLWVPLSEQLLLAKNSNEAGTLLKQAEKADADDARIDVLTAWHGAMSGAPEAATRAAILAAIEDSPTAAVYDLAAQAAARLGDRPLALRCALLSAQIAFDDEHRWFAAVGRALDAGDLTSALYASRRASDIDSKSSEINVTFQLLGTLAGDQAQADLGTERSGYTYVNDPLPASINTLANVAKDNKLLPLLRHRTDAAKEKRWLPKRATLSLEAGLLDDVASDGAVMVRKLRLPEGDALAAAAALGRWWASDTAATLGRSVRDKRVRAARMEHALITGSGDPASDARGLYKDTRARIVTQARYKPAEVAKQSISWPVGLKDPEWEPPEGFKENKILSGVDGVVGFTDKERGVSILKVDGSQGVLPPPLDLLYSREAVLSDADGIRVERHGKGVLPLYAAFVRVSGQDVIGLGLSAQAARHAVELATATPPEPAPEK